MAIVQLRTEIEYVLNAKEMDFSSFWKVQLDSIGFSLYSIFMKGQTAMLSGFNKNAHFTFSFILVEMSNNERASLFFFHLFNIPL